MRARSGHPGPDPFAALRHQLDAAASEFADGPDGLASVLRGMVDDVERALAEPLEIFPVCHHSPASATAMARFLRTRKPTTVFLEMCEDMAPVLPELRNCKLPVAVQAFATSIDGLPAAWAPLSVLAPMTEASAEYQVIAYAQQTPGVELVLVDTPSDHVIQAHARRVLSPADAGGGAAAGGHAVGVDLGDLRPRFADLEGHLLRHGQVQHWSEWWQQYVELPLGDADHATYRQVMLLIGSLFRQLTPSDSVRLGEDEARERHMWTRIREHLAATGTDPADAVLVCGAFHAASRVQEFGLHGTATFTIPARTATAWQYGLVPSSHAAIEAQFGLEPGSVSIAASQLAKNLQRTGVRPYRLKGRTGTRAAGARKAPAARTDDRLSGFLQQPPALDRIDQDELTGWCTGIVRLARANGYAASSADSIAVFETSLGLAGLRGRIRPTPYDFLDAAVTCIEKDRVPGRRDIRHLVETMLGGDRTGSVGYASLPPLARDVHDRLRPLGIDFTIRRVKRVLLDLRSDPGLQACSDVLWKLRRLLPDAVRPITGERALGVDSLQESWDVSLGAHQRALIELGYEGVTIEQVIEQRLRREAHDPTANTAAVLRAVEDAIVLLRSPRLADELGRHAIQTLACERSVDGAPEVLTRVRKLLAFYRTTEPHLPSWIEEFTSTGYAHYCTLLPVAFTEESAGVRQVAAMLGFLVSTESLAVSLGGSREQLDLAVTQSHPQNPAKVALLWAAQVHLGQLNRQDLRQQCAELLDDVLLLPVYPHYINGLLHALEPVPALVDIVVEAISNAFTKLPDELLLPWLPVLITALRTGGANLARLLTAEAERIFPGRLPELDAWVPPWSTPTVAVPGRTAVPPAGSPFLAAHPETCDALAAMLGCDGQWVAAAVPAGRILVGDHPESAAALAALLAEV
ncbi:DUF5682 family protein [Kitasatospora sp. NPDC088783]|uniref:DUF5682 family protein n=1 Tax=Kitasatospora sp. NPDC088783 TaxID=3364077 RepID=UPI003804B213